MEKIIDFYDLYWHDASIKNIYIDRTNQGTVDTIAFEINWPDGQYRFIVFEDIFWANLDLYLAAYSDAIATADILDNSDADVVNFYALHKGRLDHIKLACYLIISNSKIKILAKGFKLMESL